MKCKQCTEQKENEPHDIQIYANKIHIKFYVTVVYAYGTKFKMCHTTQIAKEIIYIYVTKFA